MTKEDQILEILHEHTKILNYHTKVLDEHTRILEEHTKKLDEHTRILDEHTRTLDEYNYILLAHSEQLNNLTKRVSSMEEKIDSIHQSIILLENDFSNKSSVLFDEHIIHQEHLEKNDKDIENLQVTTHSHSNRLISLEIDSKKHTMQLESLSSK